MIKFILMTSIQFLVLYFMFIFIPAIEVVTWAGKISGITILAVVSSLVQHLFSFRFISRYRFTLTFISLSATAILILKFLPGYTVVDTNKSLLLVITFTFLSVFLGLFCKRSR